MPDMSLAAQARRRLQAEGAPISEQNLKWAIQELEANPKTREDYSSENDLIGKQGGVIAERNNPKYPMSELRPNSGPKDEDQFFTADSQFGSDPTANQAKAKATRQKASEMANTDRKSGVMFKGGKGATPGTTSSSVSTESETSTGASIPPVKVTDLNQTKSDLNQLAPRPKPKPATMGAGPEPQPPRPSPPSQADIVGPPLQATEPGPVNTNPSPVVAGGGGVNPLAAATPGGGVGGYNPNVGQTQQGLPPQPPPIGPTAGDFDPQAAARLAGGVQGQFPDVGQTAQGQPGSAAPGLGLIDQIMAMLPEGTGQRAQNVAGMGAMLAPLAMAFLGRGAASGGRAGVTPASPASPSPTMRPRAAPTGLANMRPGGPSAAAMPETMPPNALVPNPVPGRPALGPPAVDDIGVWGSRRLSDYGQVGQRLPPQTGVVPAGPAQSVPPSVITPAAPPPQLALPAPAVQQAIGPALEAAVPQAARSAVTKAAPAAKSSPRPTVKRGEDYKVGRRSKQARQARAKKGEEPG